MRWGTRRQHYITESGVMGLIRRVDPPESSLLRGTHTGRSPESPALAETADSAVLAKLFKPFQLALDTGAMTLYIRRLWQHSRVPAKSPSQATHHHGRRRRQRGPWAMGGPATAATFGGNLCGVAVDATESVYHQQRADSQSGRSQGIISNHRREMELMVSSGDGGLATLAEVNGPQSIAVDASGNVYFRTTKTI